MKIRSTFRFALGAAALLVAGCGSVADERQSGGAGGSDAVTSGSLSTVSTTSGTSAGTTGTGGEGSCTSTAWGHAYESSIGPAFGSGVGVDPACNVFLAGTSFGPIDVGDGPFGSGTALFLAKLDPEGHTLWSHNYAKSTGATMVTLALDPVGNVLLSGLFDGDLDFGGGCVLSAKTTSTFIAKIDNDGQAIYCHQLPSKVGSSSLITSMAASAAGDVVVGGTAMGDADFDYGAGTIPTKDGLAAFVLAYDPQGNFHWAHAFPGTGYVDLHGVTISKKGVVHVTGSFVGTLDVGLGLGPGLGLDSVGGQDVFVTEIKPDGSQLWTRRIGGAGNDLPVAMVPGTEGGLIIAGMSNGSIDFGSGPLQGAGAWDIFVARLDSAGLAIGGQVYGGVEPQSLDCAASDDAGNLLLAGHYQGTIDFGAGPLPFSKPVSGVASTFSAKLDPQGKALWSRKIGGTSTKIRAVALDGSGNLVLTGTFDHETIDLESGPLSSNLEMSMFVGKIVP